MFPYNKRGNYSVKPSGVRSYSNIAILKMDMFLSSVVKLTQFSAQLALQNVPALRK